MTTKKEKKQSKGPAGMTEQELKNLKFKKRLKNKRSAKPASRLQDPFDMDDMSMPILNLSKEQLLKIAKDSLLSKAKGGEVKKYKKGGSVKKKNKMITTRGFGASRKT